MNKNTQTILGVLVVIIIAAGFYTYNNINANKIDEDTLSEMDGIEIEGDGEYEIEIIPIENTPNIPVPDLNTPVIFNESISEDARAGITEKIKKLTNELKENSGLLQNWIDLGLYRKAAGDYEGARDAWEYAGAVSPQNSLLYRNLGDLYGYYLKDSEKAEENFLKAIENGSSQIEYYFKIVEFYGDVMNDNEKARQIVEQGIEANPTSDELKSLLVSLE